MTRLPPLLLVAILLPAATLAAVEGVVSSSSGRPIEHARVEVAGGEPHAFTNMRGHFRLEADAPVQLLVSHARFEPLTIEVVDGEEPLDVVLEAKQEIYEAIAVTAQPGEENFAPVSVAITALDPEDSAAPPNTLAEFVAETPGVSENGQGGIFQTYSVRGVSRQRVITLVSGMRIVSERRAGVSASFVDPLLVSSVDVLRGPSSTYYGSGALGGVVQLFPAVHDGWTVQTGFDSRGDELHQLVGWGRDGWSVGVAHRDAGNAEAPTGEELNTGFQQTSATLSRSWSSGGLDFELLAIGAAGRDIAKSNTDFPNRTTVYPEESHGLIRFGARSDKGWDLSAYVHPNELETRVSRSDGRVNTVFNDAFDLGFNWQRRFQPSEATSVRFGVDYFGRRSVDAREVSQIGAGGPLEVTGQQKTLDGGEEDEAGLYGALEWNVGNNTLLFGGRWAYQEQSNTGSPSTDDSALSGFAGIVAPVGNGFEVVANVGSGLRFPSLSERFFSGTTGRGFVRGNPILDPERSLNIDAGLRWYGQKLYLSGYVFRNEIDDYIERIEVLPGELTFVNLSSGRIEGIELEGFYQFNPTWSSSFGGHTIEGRDDGDQPLADIPTDSFFVGGRWASGRWRADGRWEIRRAKNDPGSGEKPIASAQLVSASLAYEMTPGVDLVVSGRNLLDEEYFNSADSDVPLSTERSFSASVRWRPEAP